MGDVDVLEIISALEEVCERRDERGVVQCIMVRAQQLEALEERNADVRLHQHESGKGAYLRRPTEVENDVRQALAKCNLINFLGCCR